MLRSVPHLGRSLVMKSERRVTFEDLKRQPPVTLPLSTIVAFAQVAERDPPIAELVWTQYEDPPVRDDESEDNQNTLVMYAKGYLESIGISRALSVPLLESYRLVYLNLKKKGRISEIDDRSAREALRRSAHVNWEK